MLRWIIVAALLAAAAWTAWRSWRASRVVKAAKGWNRVRATVRDSRVEAVKAVDFEHRQTTVFQPKITYAYEACGAIRTSSRYALDPESFNARGAAEKVVADYPVGTTVEALVDPADPDRACLTAKADLNLTAPVAFLIIAGIAASGVIGV